MASSHGGARALYRRVTTGPQRERVRRWRRYLALFHVGNPYPRERFIILAHERSGSTLLHRLIDQHPDIRCEGEILHASRGRLSFPELYLEVRSMTARRARTPAYGCKVSPNHILERGLDPRDFLVRTTSRGWRLIHLRRDDLFRRAVSLLAAVLRGQWVYRGGAPPREPLALDPRALVQQIHLLVWLGDLERRALDGLDRLELVYERDLLRSEQHQETADRVFRWLGLPPAPVSATLARIAPDDLRTVLTNYDQLAEAVRRAGLGRYLADVAPGEAVPGQPRI